MSDNNPIFNDLASKLEGLSAEDQRAVMARLDTITSREYMAAEAAKEAQRVRLRREIEPLVAQLNEALKHPTANRVKIAQLKKELDAKSHELEAL